MGKMPARPPLHAKYSARATAADAQQRAHDAAMRRPNEPLHLASHSLAGRAPVAPPAETPASPDPVVPADAGTHTA